MTYRFTIDNDVYARTAVVCTLLLYNRGRRPGFKINGLSPGDTLLRGRRVWRNRSVGTIVRRVE